MLSRGQPHPISKRSSDPTLLTRSLWSVSSARLVSLLLHTCTSHSRLPSVLAPRWLNDLPMEVRTADSLSSLKCRLKTHLFRTYLSSARSCSSGPRLTFFFGFWLN
ncbi:hypothetical protein JZ751_027142 [Albula glossodonta]|uniref:Uncharacterized protein n=1 Tax=Albula glossodonta TaxID=121402 RepID=A0A8T2NE43_9TELE|nr:hypothetical protein JZ751_027142 [Albula glossodonta]